MRRKENVVLAVTSPFSLTFTSLLFPLSFSLAKLALLYFNLSFSVHAILDVGFGALFHRFVTRQHPVWISRPYVVHSRHTSARRCADPPLLAKGSNVSYKGIFYSCLDF